MQNEVSNRNQNQNQNQPIQIQPQSQTKQQPQTPPKAQPKTQPHRMDLSEYDAANDDIISVSNAPESAVTSDERVSHKLASQMYSYSNLSILNPMSI